MSISEVHLEKLLYTYLDALNELIEKANKMEERVAELERTVRLLNDRDNPGSGSGRVSRWSE